MLALAKELAGGSFAGRPSPYYVVFAGVNGAGKSTLYRSDLWRTSNMPARMERVNPDEILVEQGGSWRSVADQIRSGREALRRVEDYLERRISFSQETTLSGKTSLKIVERAREAGFRVHILYVRVDCAETALRRIRGRVDRGGHGIDEGAVRRRVRTSIRHFSHAIDLCEEATVLDNTKEFRTVAQWGRGTLSWWGNPSAHAPWLIDAMADKEVWRA